MENHKGTLTFNYDDIININELVENSSIDIKSAIRVQLIINSITPKYVSDVKFVGGQNEYFQKYLDIYLEEINEVVKEDTR